MASLFSTGFFPKVVHWATRPAGLVGLLVVAALAVAAVWRIAGVRPAAEPPADPTQPPA